MCLTSAKSELFELLVKHLYEEKDKDNSIELIKIKKSVEKQKIRIANLQDMFIDGVVDQDSFQSMNKRYKEELYLLNIRLGNMSSNKLKVIKFLKKGVNALSKMSNPYKAASTLRKQQFLKAIFPGQTHHKLSTFLR